MSLSPHFSLYLCLPVWTFSPLLSSLNFLCLFSLPLSFISSFRIFFPSQSVSSFLSSVFPLLLSSLIPPLFSHSVSSSPLLSSPISPSFVCLFFPSHKSLLLMSPSLTCLRLLFFPAGEGWERRIPDDMGFVYTHGGEGGGGGRRRRGWELYKTAGENGLLRLNYRLHKGKENVKERKCLIYIESNLNKQENY